MGFIWFIGRKWCVMLKALINHCGFFGLSFCFGSWKWFCLVALVAGLQHTGLWVAELLLMQTLRCNPVFLRTQVNKRECESRLQQASSWVFYYPASRFLSIHCWSGCVTWHFCYLLIFTTLKTTRVKKLDISGAFHELERASLQKIV